MTVTLTSLLVTSQSSMTLKLVSGELSLSFCSTMYCGISWFLTSHFSADILEVANT